MVCCKVFTTDICHYVFFKFKSEEQLFQTAGTQTVLLVAKQTTVNKMGLKAGDAARLWVESTNAQQGEFLSFKIFEKVSYNQEDPEWGQE